MSATLEVNGQTVAVVEGRGWEPSWAAGSHTTPAHIAVVIRISATTRLMELDTGKAEIRLTLADGQVVHGSDLWLVQGLEVHRDFASLRYEGPAGAVWG